MSGFFDSPGTYRLKAQQEGGAWRLVSERVTSQDRMDMLREALHDALPRLGFELAAAPDPEGFDTLSVPVIPPQRRSWNRSVLESADILGANATIEVRTASGRRPSVRWTQTDLNTETAVGDGTTNLPIGEGAVIALASSVPSVTLDTPRATWNEATEELTIQTSAGFEHLPRFTEAMTAKVSMAGSDETFDGAYDPAAQLWRTAIRLRQERPRTVELHVTWEGRWKDAPLQSRLTVDVPIVFGPAEFITAEREFAPHIFLGLPPSSVRFLQHDYLPGEIALSFSFRNQLSRCKARHRENTSEPALYDIEWVEGALEDFHHAAPGVIRLTIAGETGPSRAVILIPGVIAGTWTLADELPMFRLASTTLDENLIQAASDSLSPEPLKVKVKGRQVLLTDDNLRPVTHLVLTDGSRIPIHPAAFSPLFLRDPLGVWRQSSQRPRIRLTGNLTEPLAPATLLRGATATPIKDSLSGGSMAATILQSVGAGPALFDFAASRQQLLIYRPDVQTRFATAIRGDAVPSTGLTGLYFRGFYFTVEVVNVEGPFAPNSKLLLLRQPLRLTFGPLTNHIMPFAPLRGAYSPEQSLVTIIDGTRTVGLTLDETNVIREAPRSAFGRLGYVYGNRQAPRWTPAAAATPPWLYTFDNLAFILDDEYLAFAGWLLPGGSALFPAQPPFSAYAFDFSGTQAGAVAILDPFPLRVRQWTARLPGIPDEDWPAFEKEVEPKLRELDVQAGHLQQTGSAEFSIDLKDGRSYQAVLEFDPGTNEVRLLVRPPLRTPAVQFFTLA